MDAIQCIKTRRSIRSYNNKEVTPEVIADIVNVATFAPSWKNSQTTRYIAVLDKATKDKIAHDGVLGFESNTRIISSAPALIVVTTVNGRSGYERDGSFSTSKGTHFESFDAGIATEAFTLVAHNMGLATVIMGIFDEQALKDILSVPEGQSVSALVALGYTDIEAAAPKRKTSDELLTII